MVCAQEALVQLELERVVFMPVGEAPHREIEQDPGAEARLDMAELAVADDERFEASRMELDRNGPSYTSDTLEALHEESPDDELFLILGGDQAAALGGWHEPAPRASGTADPVPGAGQGGRLHHLQRPVRGGPRRGGRDPVSAATPVDSAALAERIAEIASDKKAIDIRVIDLRGIVSYTDFFVIASGNTERQAKAIHDAIHEELKKGGDERLLPRRTEGEREARWILLDYWDVVVHIFTPEAREYYRLENLWGEAPARSVG
jgi:ribosome-associated protein